jgi:RHS repeat-associated protein
LHVTRALQPLATYSYTQHRTGHRSRAVESTTGGPPVNLPFTRSVTYQYDNLYRLTNEQITATTSPSGAIAYQHDPVGNRLTRTSTVANVSNQSFTYDANDRLQSDTYDANGNTTVGQTSLSATGAETTLSVVTDTYDAENRLTTRTGSNNVQVTYDGDGHKVRETVNGETLTYLIDTKSLTGYAQVVEELQNGTVVRTYTYSHDLLVQDQRTGPTTWSANCYLYDGHGSVRALTDGVGQITDRYDYEAFGQLLQSEGTTDNHYRYCGEQYAPALGLYYLRARFMNAANGRFWNADSYEGVKAIPSTQHKYFYANTDPVNGSDPSGLATTVAEVNNGSALSQALTSMAVTAIALGVGYETVEQVK